MWGSVSSASGYKVCTQYTDCEYSIMPFFSQVYYQPTKSYQVKIDHIALICKQSTLPEHESLLHQDSTQPVPTLCTSRLPMQPERVSKVHLFQQCLHQKVSKKGRVGIDYDGSVHSP